MPAPFTVWNPVTGKPIATFDTTGDLYLSGGVTTDGQVSNDGQTILRGSGVAAGGGAGTGVYIYEAAGAYPLRDTVAASNAQTVTWVGPDAPTIGSGYALDGTDLWIPTLT